MATIKNKAVDTKSQYPIGWKHPLPSLQRAFRARSYRSQSQANISVPATKKIATYVLFKEPLQG